MVLSVGITFTGSLAPIQLGSRSPSANSTTKSGSSYPLAVFLPLVLSSLLNNGLLQPIRYLSTLRLYINIPLNVCQYFFRLFTTFFEYFLRKWGYCVV